MIKKGTWVEIEEIVLKPEERSGSIPDDTKKTPLKVWAKGYCQEDCNIGEEAEIKTTTGRILKGTVTMEKPGFTHGFGEFVEEIMYIGSQAKEILFSEQ